LIPDYYSNISDSAELVHNHEQSLELADILPLKERSYDKNRAPKLLGQPTVVYFHVTVLSIDSINEESMTYVTDIFLAQRYSHFKISTLLAASIRSFVSISQNIFIYYFVLFLAGEIQGLDYQKI
jgi:hypothetical protein